MALIKIKGRRDALVVSDAIAKKIKERKFGVAGYETPADPSEGITIIHESGEWDGEYSRIAEIDLQRKEDQRDRAAEMRKEDREADEKLLARSAEAKGAEFGYFKLLYSYRTGDFKTNPPEEILVRVQKLQTRYFTKYTRAFMVPSHLYGSLLPPKQDYKSLAESKRVVRTANEITYPE